MKNLIKIVTVFFVVLSFSYVFLFSNAPQALALTTSFQGGNITLSNSRLSYRGQIGSASGASATNFVITATPGAPATDPDTNNLFPRDLVCFNNPVSNGCASQTTYMINNTASNVQFSTAATVANAMTVGTNVISTQSAQMTVSFTANTGVASGGFLRLTIPDTATSNADGMPDNVGFDSNTLPANLLSGTCAANVCLSFTGFTASAATLTTTPGTGHVVLITLSSALVPTTSYSFTLGHATTTSSLRFILPSPASLAHTRGVADTYSITLQSEDSGSVAQDKTIMKVAPVDGVLVSATIEETISYTISGAGPSAGVCGTTTIGTATTATSIPFGSITASNTFYDQAQSHLVITNAANGYNLTVYENQALSLNGAGVTTIANTSCNGAACSAGASGAVCTPAAWSTTSVNGFGYTLANNAQSDASFTNASGYCPFATVPNKIMAKVSPTVSSGSSIYLCPRLNVSATQSTGTYLNNLTFIATANF